MKIIDGKARTVSAIGGSSRHLAVHGCLYPEAVPAGSGARNLAKMLA